jgi:ribosomal protein S18 acetylase RimI-like enzyme
MRIRSNTFDIRPVTAEDYVAVLEVYRQCEDFLSLGPEPKASVAMVRKDISIARREGRRFCGVFTAEGTMIGVVEFLPSGFEGKPQLAFLSLLMIAAPYRNQGLGASVLDFVEREIRKDSEITAIFSAVQANNPKAFQFWQGKGYRLVGEPQLQPDKTTTVLLRKEFTGKARQTGTV